MEHLNIKSITQKGKVDKFSLLNKLSRYGIVGLLAAIIHFIVLTFLKEKFPFSISNIIAFLSASFWSYLGHATFTFKIETGGKFFARRWLGIQFSINILVCALLPLVLNRFKSNEITTLILVFTPTLLNFLIWRKAAKFSLRSQDISKINPKLHADDLGLSKATNQSIIFLAKSQIIDSTSVLINGNSLKEAIYELKECENFTLFLHLCLTEGAPITPLPEIRNLVSSKGLLNMSFFNLLFISLLPKNNRIYLRVKKQLITEIRNQISLYKELTQLKHIKIDGHQHIHLIPIILDIILEISREEEIKWVRTTSEPIPTGLPFIALVSTLRTGGFIKWVILQILSKLAKKKLQQANLQTNSSFSGILFTGRMTEKILALAWKKLKQNSSLDENTAPIILTHPANSLQTKLNKSDLINFHLSKDFSTSPWRMHELDSLIKFKNYVLNQKNKSS